MHIGVWNTPKFNFKTCSFWGLKPSTWDGSFWDLERLHGDFTSALHWSVHSAWGHSSEITSAQKLFWPHHSYSIMSIFFRKATDSWPQQLWSYFPLSPYSQQCACSKLSYVSLFPLSDRESLTIPCCLHTPLRVLLTHASSGKLPSAPLVSDHFFISIALWVCLTVIFCYEIIAR